MNKDKMIEWIVTHDVGVSSKAMWTALMGVNPTLPMHEYDVPHDAADFSRCYDLVKFCEVEWHDMEKIYHAFSWWVPIIRKWKKLAEMYEEEDYKGINRLLSDLREEVIVLKRIYRDERERNK